MKILRTPNRITIVTNVPAVSELGRVNVQSIGTDELTGEKFVEDNYGFQYTDNCGSSIGEAYCESGEQIDGCIAFSYPVCADQKTKDFCASKRRTLEKIMKFEDQAAAQVAKLQAEKAAAQAKFDSLFVD